MKATKKHWQLFTYCHFISHMVQMKGSFFRGRKKQIFALYPTWFRWKLARRTILFEAFFLFISHMVQMKDIKSQCQKDLKMSLYPTWFRWKFPFFPLFLLGKRLYIPHGSDERKHKSSRKNSKTLLYIPHGSDESCFNEQQFISKRHFISHMVQMKETITVCGIWSFHTLYPTWFRWKLLCYCYRPFTFSFISHMVQMKA